MGRLNALCRALLVAICLVGLTRPALPDSLTAEQPRSFDDRGVTNLVEGEPVLPESMLEWGLKQTGLLAVLILVLYFYRRDYQALTTFHKDFGATMKELVQENTKATVEMAGALRSNTEVVHGAKNAMQSFVNIQEAQHRRPGEERRRQT